jgi:uncharacterized membrane protein
MGKGDTTAYAVTIYRPRHEVYSFWRDWQNLPRFARHLKSVEDLGDGRTRWTAVGPKEEDVTWEAETTEDIPGERIAWRTVGDADVPNEGEIVFLDAPMDRGTEVMARLAYDIPYGIAGKLTAKTSGASPEAEVGETMRRFKALLECGEIAINEGQPSNIKRGDNMPGDPTPKAGLR